MKGNGLSSTHRTLLKKANRQSTHASNEVGFRLAKERQKAMRLMAEKAQNERNARALEQQNAATPSKD